MTGLFVLKQLTSSDFCTSMDLLISVACIALKEAHKMIFFKWRENTCTNDWSTE